jgi:tetratricopeptide (TPR) repeat protein
MNNESNKIVSSLTNGSYGLFVILFAVMQICGFVNAATDSESLDPSDLLLNKITITKKTPVVVSDSENDRICSNKVVVISDKFAANVDQNVPAAILPAANFQKEIKAQIMQSNITPIVDKGQKEEDTGLQELISKIGSIKLGQKEAQVPQEQLEAEPQEAAADESDTPIQKEAQEEKAAAGEQISSNKISPETLEIIKKAASDTSKVEKPLELAEIMFESGYYEQAAGFYKEELGRLDAKTDKSADEISWILFQLGNCQKNVDPNEAIKTYRQLILQYPQSSWAEAAKAQEQFTQWYQKDMSAVRKNKK